MKLKPCPFCGSRNRKQFSTDKAWHNGFIRCWKCNATGPWIYQGAGKNAERAWNRRAPWRESWND